MASTPGGMARAVELVAEGRAPLAAHPVIANRTSSPAMATPADALGRLIGPTVQDAIVRSLLVLIVGYSE